MGSPTDRRSRYDTLTKRPRTPAQVGPIRLGCAPRLIAHGPRIDGRASMEHQEAGCRQSFSENSNSDTAMSAKPRKKKILCGWTAA